MPPNNAGVKYTQLPVAVALDGAEVLAIAQAGVSKQMSVSTFIAAIPAVRVTYVAAAGASNNVTPAGFGPTTRYLEVNTAAGAAQFTGLIAGANGQRVVVTPIGAGTLRLDALAGASAAANQFRAAANTLLVTNLSVEIEYSTEIGKWLVIP